MRISDWSSDVCSSDLHAVVHVEHQLANLGEAPDRARRHAPRVQLVDLAVVVEDDLVEGLGHGGIVRPSIPLHLRSEEHTSELQSLMRSSYAVFCLKKKK